MDRDSQIELVRSLTREVVAALRPEEMATFAGDFAMAAINGGHLRVEESVPIHPPRSQTLDTTLVAGMFFQVLREAEKLPVSIPERVSFIRRQAKSYLATRLAGQIPLSQFFRLLNLIEENVQGYFEEARGSWVKPKAAPRQELRPPPPRKTTSVWRTCAWPWKPCPSSPMAGANSPARCWRSFSGRPGATGSGFWTSRSASGSTRKRPGPTSPSCTRRASCSITAKRPTRSATCWPIPFSGKVFWGGQGPEIPALPPNPPPSPHNTLVTRASRPGRHGLEAHATAKRLVSCHPLGCFSQTSTVLADPPQKSYIYKLGLQP